MLYKEIVVAHRYTHTLRRTSQLEIESAQWADSVKIQCKFCIVLVMTPLAPPPFKSVCK